MHSLVSVIHTEHSYQLDVHTLDYKMPNHFDHGFISVADAKANSVCQ